MGVREYPYQDIHDPPFMKVAEVALPMVVSTQPFAAVQIQPNRAYQQVRVHSRNILPHFAYSYKSQIAPTTLCTPSVEYKNSVEKLFASTPQLFVHTFWAG